MILSNATPSTSAAVSRAWEAAESYIRLGPEKTMDRFNGGA